MGHGVSADYSHSPPLTTVCGPLVLTAVLTPKVNGINHGVQTDAPHRQGESAPEPWPAATLISHPWHLSSRHSTRKPARPSRNDGSGDECGNHCDEDPGSEFRDLPVLAPTRAAPG